MNSTANLKKSTHFLLLLVSILIVWTVLQAIVVSATLPLTYEEGLNLQVSHFISQGYEPYTQIFTQANPLFVWLVGWLGKLGLAVGRIKLVFLFFGALFLAATATLTYILLNAKAALATTFLLASATTFATEAAAVADVIPATTLAVLSLLFVTQYLATRRLFWLLLSGIVWSAALFVSTSALSFGPVALLLLVFSKPNGENSVTSASGSFVYKSVGVWCASVIFSLVVGLYLATPTVIFGYIFKNFMITQENLSPTQAGNFTLIGQFLVFNIWLSLFAIYAMVQLYQKWNHILWIIVVWFLIGAAWLMVQALPNLADTAILLPSLSMISGWGLSNAAQWLTGYRRYWQTRASSRRLLVSSIVLLVVGVYVLVSWQRYNEFVFREVDTRDDFTQIQQREELTAFIQQYTNAYDCVLIDDPALAVLANRLPTPQLVGLSEERIKSGLLTSKRLEQLIEEGQCTAIVFSKREYHDEYFVGFGGWLREHYPHEDKYIRTRIRYR